MGLELNLAFHVGLFFILFSILFIILSPSKSFSDTIGIVMFNSIKS